MHTEELTGNGCALRVHDEVSEIWNFDNFRIKKFRNVEVYKFENLKIFKVRKLNS